MSAPTRTLTVADLDRLIILKGDQVKPSKAQLEALDVQACTMQLVSLLANEPWSDHPRCACPYITSFVIHWQDAITDDVRRTELMRPLIPLILGTRGSDALMLRRMWMGIDWDIRVRTPAFLRLVPGLAEHASALEALPEIVDQAGLGRAREVAQAASRAASAARAAAWDAARDAARAAARDAAWDAARAAAWDAARAAAWDAARAAARDAAWDAARDAARAAARDAAWDAAWDAARDAARDAAWDAAWDAARAAAWDAARDAARDAAWDAAWDAGGKRLAPLVAEMQASAQDLVRRLCALKEES